MNQNISLETSPHECCCNYLPYLGFFKGFVARKHVCYYIAVAGFCLNHEKVAKVLNHEKVAKV